MTAAGRSGGDAALVAALAGGATYAAAGDRAGVSERTVRRRLADPAFKRQLDDARAEIVAAAVARLSAASGEAVDALRGLLTSELDFARLGAARAILELGLKLREQHDLADRIDDLERALAQQKEHRPWHPRSTA